MSKRPQRVLDTAAKEALLLRHASGETLGCRRLPRWGVSGRTMRDRRAMGRGIAGGEAECNWYHVPVIPRNPVIPQGFLLTCCRGLSSCMQA